MFVDNIRVIKSPYEKQFEYLFLNDFVKDAPSRVKATGTD